VKRIGKDVRGMKERLSEDVIAMRAAKELKAGDCCNLGIGVPNLCAMYVPEGVFFEAENGALGYGSLVTVENWQEADCNLVDAGARLVTAAPGMSVFDFLTSFCMIRSGRLITVLGALEVSEMGDLASHSIGEKDEYLMIGGAMDLAWGAKRVIITMTHTTKQGKPKIVHELSLPPTGRQCVDLVITDVAVIEVLGKRRYKQGELLLREVAPGWTPEDVQAITEPKLIVASDVKEMEF
jgi:3-oxoacid CoA-transferase B subunit